MNLMIDTLSILMDSDRAAGIFPAALSLLVINILAAGFFW